MATEARNKTSAVVGLSERASTRPLQSPTASAARFSSDVLAERLRRDVAALRYAAVGAKRACPHGADAVGAVA